MPLAPSSFPFDTTEFRIGGFQLPFLRRWYERARQCELSHPNDKAARIFWPGFLLTFDFHLHLATYAVSDTPHWPLSLIREQPVAQLALRCPFFCLVLVYRAYDWASFLTWRSEIAFYYQHTPGWRFVEGGRIFEKEWRRKFGEWFLSERAVRLANDGWTKEIKFERVY